ncbi:retroviral-like aspartic protease family protein [Dyella acidiphila]|uniref:Retropepsin-like domain-containing protein n=1 Tax=Dyella acidiphila TaxID=2775866 RepID=A0ABR9GFM0_9GAMM|nr:aspartyl protease family protein [Dyella acidiphila]MBE1162816.1 retropepsin-like domain-containing protein [Dyella acidiphila]
MRLPLPLAALSLALALSFPLLAQTPASTASTIQENPSATLIRAVIEAVRKADLPALDQLDTQSTDPATHALTAMARSRIHADFQQSGQQAKACEQQFLSSNPGVAIFCARFGIGDLRLAGQEAQAEQADLDMVQRYASKLSPDALQGMQAHAALYDKQPALDVQRPAGAFTIPLQPHNFRKQNGDLHQSNNRDIAVTVNGHEAVLDVNTAAAYVILDPSTARELGVRITDANAIANGPLSKHVPVQFGIIDKLSFAGVTVSNAPVMVDPGNDRTVLGMGILKYLGAFRMTKDAIQVYATNGNTPPAAAQPMLVGTAVDGRSLRLVAPLSINGSTELAVLNTGNPFYLTGDKDALAELDTRFAGQTRMRDAGPMVHRTVFNRTIADVVIGGQPMKLKFGVYAEAEMNWKYQLGLSALQDMDIYVDFANRQLALIPKADIK